MEKISEQQLMLITANYIFVGASLSLPAQIISVAQQDSWLSYLGPTLLMLLVLYLLVKTLDRFPKQDLLQALASRWPVFGRGIAILYILFFFLILTRDLRMLTDFVNISLLLNTPLIVIGLLTLTAILWIARGGVEIVGRMTEFFFPIIAVVVLLIPLSLFKELNVKYFLPFFEYGVDHLFKGSWLAIPTFGEAIVIAFLSAGTKLSYKKAIKGLLIGVVLLELLIAINLMVFGSHLSARMMYPNHEMVRQIRLTDFLDRFDLLIVALYLPCLIMKIAATLYVVCHSMKSVIKTISARDLVPSMAALALVCSMFFYENSIQILNLNFTWPYLSILFQILLPVLFFFFLKPKKQPAKPEETKEEAA